MLIENKLLTGEPKTKTYSIKCFIKLAQENKQLIEQLTNENEALKDTIAVVLVQKKNVEKNIRKQVCETIRQEFEKRLKGKKWEDSIVIGKVCNTINDVIDQIEQAKESICKK